VRVLNELGVEGRLEGTNRDVLAVGRGVHVIRRVARVEPVRAALGGPLADRVERVVVGREDRRRVDNLPAALVVREGEQSLTPGGDVRPVLGNSS
jgi:hypothetical protein